MALHEVDVHVGGRIRQRRLLLGMTQTTLGAAVGLTFQQVQKYERGYNRVSSSRLYEFAKVLGVSVSYFFDDMSGKRAASGARAELGKINPDGRQGSLSQGDLLMRRETLQLLRAYYKIRAKVVRGGVTRMIKLLAAMDGLSK